jgi:hypothetical protein
LKAGLQREAVDLWMRFKNVSQIQPLSFYDKLLQEQISKLTGTQVAIQTHVQSIFYFAFFIFLYVVLFLYVFISSYFLLVLLSLISFLFTLIFSLFFFIGTLPSDQIQLLDFKITKIFRQILLKEVSKAATGSLILPTKTNKYK